MLRVCRQCATQLGCSTAYWECRHLARTVRWLHEDLSLGAVTGASIPRGIPNEVAGGGCIPLTLMHAVTRLQATWAEGRALPGLDGYTWPPGTPDHEIDTGVTGRVGLAGGAVCEIPEGNRDTTCSLSVGFENGHLWLSNYRVPVVIQGTGALAAPVYPRFYRQPTRVLVTPRVAQLVDAVESGEPVECRGAELADALEIAIALKRSAHDGGRRVELPIADRSARILPQPHRHLGGDAIGWDRSEYGNPPGPEAPPLIHDQRGHEGEGDRVSQRD